MPNSGTQESRRLPLAARLGLSGAGPCVVLALVLFGCGGQASGAAAKPKQQLGDSRHGSKDMAPFQCEDRAAVPDAQPLRRLSNEQLRNTVSDLVEFALPAELAGQANRGLSAVLAGLPPDEVSRSAPFSTMDQTVSDQHVDAYLKLAQELAVRLTLDDKYLQALFSCAPNATPAACVDAFIRRFGRRAFRHALSDGELEFLRASYGPPTVSQAAVRNLLVLMFNMPQFLYHSEQVSKPTAGDPSIYLLHPYALASRLSYQYWQTMPDEALLTAAEQGDLDDEAGLTRTVDRMLNDPRARRGLRVFILEWFRLQTLRPLDALVGDPVFDAFAGDDLPSPDLRDAMLSDVTDSFIFHTAGGGSYRQWLVSPYSFARGDELAAIYDVQPWDGRTDPPKFKAGTRAGLLTRAALVATGSANTRPIMKGVFIRRLLLCDDIPPPPCNAMTVPVLSTEFTTRQTVEALTEQPGTSCASCHAYQINPLGYATENYDGLGRLRSEQRLFSQSGAEVARKRVDTHGIPRVSLFDPSPVDGAADLTARILESGKGEACFARQFLRFSYGRAEDLRGDGCVLEGMRTALQKPNGLREAMRVPALSPSFRQRRVLTEVAQ